MFRQLMPIIGEWPLAITHLFEKPFSIVITLIGTCHPRPLFEQKEAGRSSDSQCGARDDCDLALESVHKCSWLIDLHSY